MLAGTIAMIQTKPWTGFGLDTFRTVYPAYASVDFGAVVQHAHNDWAEWAADGGIPFSLLLLSIAIWSIPKAFRAAWGIGLIAVFVHGAIDFPLHKPVLDLWLFALLGVLAAHSERPWRRDAGSPAESGAKRPGASFAPTGLEILDWRAVEPTRAGKRFREVLQVVLHSAAGFKRHPADGARPVQSSKARPGGLKSAAR